jgi:resuscitation-promoting factor RpfB
VIAVIAVISVAIVARISAPKTSTAGADAVFAAIPGSQALAAIVAERQQLIAMTAAAQTLTVVTKPALASPGQIASSNPSATSASTAGGITYIPSTPPDPSTAESIAYNMMGSFGFPPTVYYGCLDDLWQRESGWLYDAENPASGAYGIPQALPGSKMASAGGDWQTDPATQIRWGLGYIQGQYGNPCAAWAFEEDHGYY